MAKFDSDKIFIYIITKNESQIQNYINSGYDVNRIFSKKDYDLISNLFIIDEFNNKYFHGISDSYFKNLIQLNSTLLYVTCVTMNYSNIAKILLKAGANPNILIKSWAGSSNYKMLIHHVLDANHQSCANVLLQYNADTSTDINSHIQFTYSKRIELLKQMKNEIINKKFKLLLNENKK